MRRLLLLPLLTLPALAQSALSPLKDHPLLKQAEAYLLAARKSLEAQAAPLALNVQGNYLRYGYTCEPEAVCASLPEAAQSLTLALVLAHDHHHRRPRRLLRACQVPALRHHRHRIPARTHLLVQAVPDPDGFARR